MTKVNDTGGAMAEFAARLKSLISDPCSGRPFVCSGSPLACRIFIVGQNPARDTTNFWNYWSDEAGMDRETWRMHYLARGRLSSTRKRIERLAALIMTPVLETNVWCAEARSTALVTRSQKATTVFQLLLEEIRPSLIIAHGSKAATVLDELRPAAKVIAVPHLSGLGSPKGFGWNDTKLKDLAAQVNARI